MVHSEVGLYLNKYVVSIAPFSTPACPSKYDINIIKTALLCMFSLLTFHPFSQGRSADPICPYVRTPGASMPYVPDHPRTPPGVSECVDLYSA